MVEDDVLFRVRQEVSNSDSARSSIPMTHASQACPKDARISFAVFTMLVKRCSNLQPAPTKAAYDGSKVRC
jgi:hypothetical protein